MPVNTFFCYTHKDAPLVDQLETHLRPLQRQGLINMWYDREITAGSEWKHAIDRHLNMAQIILLMISPDFMNSDYAYSIEMQQALARHKHGEAIVIPVILRPAHWQGAPFAKLQALPTDAKPITSSQWHDLDEAFLNVAEGIRKTVEDLTGSTPPRLTSVDRTIADRKVDEARQKVQQWGERIVREELWDWHLLGEALQLAHEAIENDSNHQRAWTFLADAYHRIGKTELAVQCLRKSKSLAPPSPNFPGRFYRDVEENIRSGYPFNAVGGLTRQPPPQWFIDKYQKYWSLA
jgi:tetratricopeptide (TPR) repeat protein